MKSIGLASILALTATTSGVLADGHNRTPMEIARAQEACGEDQNARIVSARFLEDGRVGVTCAAVARTAAGVGTGGAAAGIGLLTLVLVAAAAGGNGSSTSDTQ